MHLYAKLSLEKLRSLYRQITFVGQFSDFFQLRFYFLESSVEGTVQQLANNFWIGGLVY